MQVTNNLRSFVEYAQERVEPSVARWKELKADVKEAQKGVAELRSTEAKLQVRLATQSCSTTSISEWYRSSTPCNTSCQSRARLQTWCRLAGDEYWQIACAATLRQCRTYKVAS